MQEALRVFQRVGVGGEAGFGQAGGHDAGMGGFAGMERLGHGAEIRHQAGGLRCAEGDGDGGFLGVQLAQLGAGRGGADRAIKPGGMPALLVQQPGVAAEQFSPGLIAGDVGGDHVGAGGAEMFGLGQDGGDQDGAGMAAQGDIVIVQRMGGGAVDPGGFRSRGLAVAEGQGGGTVAGCQRLGHDAHAVFVAAGDHGADGVDEAHARDAGGLLRQAVRREVGDELAKGFGQAHGMFLRQRCGCGRGWTAAQVQQGHRYSRDPSARQRADRDDMTAWLQVRSARLSKPRDQ